MSKPADFSSDLSMVADGVAVDVKDILKGLRQKSEPPAKPIEIQKPLTDNAEVLQPTEAPAEVPLSNDSATNRTRKSRQQVQTKIAVAPGTRIAKERLTTRIMPHTKELLEEARNWQKVKRQQPDDYEDIVDEALTDWYRKMGYLK